MSSLKVLINKAHLISIQLASQLPTVCVMKQTCLCFVRYCSWHRAGFMKPEGSLQCSQNPNIGLYSAHHQFTPQL
jgi:hypothetical protein